MRAEAAAQGDPFGGNASSPTTYVMNSDNSWYFYNSSTVTAGKTDFQRRWGSRKLEDDWRRRNKASYAFESSEPAEEEEAEAAEGEEVATEEETVDKEAEERAKEKKPIVPDFAKVVEFAVSVGKDRDDIELSVNDKQTMYKFVHDGTAFITLQKTNNDYRLAFLAKTEEMRELLYQYNGVISFDKVVEFDKAKYSVQQLKAVYKGDETLSIEVVQNLLTNSLAVLLEAEDLEAQAIAKEQAAKERAKLAEQALREKEKALAKEEAKRQKELQKAQEEAEKEQANSEPANSEEAA